MLVAGANKKAGAKETAAAATLDLCVCVCVFGCVVFERNTLVMRTLSNPVLLDTFPFKRKPSCLYCNQQIDLEQAHSIELLTEFCLNRVMWSIQSTQNDRIRINPTNRHRLTNY